MAAKNYLELPASGIPIEKSATITSAGAANEGDLVALDGSGRLDVTVLPVGVGPEARTVVASETITGPALVNLWNDSGALKMRYADASAVNAGKVAHGYVTNTVNSAASGTVFIEGIITGLSALTIGSRYFLSGTVPGGVTTAAPTTTAHSVQEIGLALSATELTFEPGKPIIRA